jgi:hypothetical protein
MYLVHLCGAAVLAFTVSAEAQKLDRSQFADCAGLSANSLEAAMLKCDPASLRGSKVTDTGLATWEDASDEDRPSDLQVPSNEPAAMEISSKNW